MNDLAERMKTYTGWCVIEWAITSRVHNHMNEVLKKFHEQQEKEIKENSVFFRIKKMLKKVKNNL